MRFFPMMLVGALSLAALPARADDFTPAQKTAIEQIVKDYLVKHPEVLREALTEVEKLQKAEEKEQQVKTVVENKTEIFQSPYQANVGAPNGKVTLVEFFDYNCGYCKRALGDIGKLMSENPDLKVVLKDFPVLGQNSVETAQVAAALRNQFQGEKYWEFHQKLLGAHGQSTRAGALAVAKDMGADMDKLDKDMKSPEVRAGLSEALKLGDKLAISGTPAFVIGDEVVVGAVGHDELRAKIDNVRKCGKTDCG